MTDCLICKENIHPKFDSRREVEGGWVHSCCQRDLEFTTQLKFTFCSMCAGTGKNIDHSACESCNGDGKIWYISEEQLNLIRKKEDKEDE